MNTVAPSPDLWMIYSARWELHMSRVQRRKSGVAAVAANQLDLFGSPVSVARQSQQRPRSPTRDSKSIGRSAEKRAPPTNSAKAAPGAHPDRKLLDFVLGADRRRGRRPKALQPIDEKPVDEKRLLDVREAAARLGLSKSTLDKMRCTGRGPRFIRATDRAIRYDPEDLRAFADERRRRSTSHMIEALNA